MCQRKPEFGILSDNEHTVNGLIRKRAEIAGRIEHLQDELRSLVIDLDSVDHTLRLFQPDIALEDIKPKALPPRHEAFRGQLTRIVFTALREAAGPLTTQDIAKRVMEDRGVDPANAKLKRVIAKRTGACLRHWERLGKLKKEPGPGQFKLWAICAERVITSSLDRQEQP